MLGPNRFYGRKVLGETLPGSTLRQVVGWHPVDAPIEPDALATHGFGNNSGAPLGRAAQSRWKDLCGSCRVRVLITVLRPWLARLPTVGVRETSCQILSRHLSRRPPRPQRTAIRWKGRCGCTHGLRLQATMVQRRRSYYRLVGAWKLAGKAVGSGYETTSWVWFLQQSTQ